MPVHAKLTTIKSNLVLILFSKPSHNILPKMSVLLVSGSLQKTSKISHTEWDWMNIHQVSVNIVIFLQTVPEPILRAVKIEGIKVNNQCLIITHESFSNTTKKVRWNTLILSFNENIYYDSCIYNCSDLKIVNRIINILSYTELHFKTS